MDDRIITLHDLESPRKEVRVSPDAIVDLAWASMRGGSVVYLADGTHLSVDENCNHVALIAGIIKGKQCAIGSRSGMYYYHTPEIPGEENDPRV